jgi:hypothetical protein
MQKKNNKEIKKDFRLRGKKLYLTYSQLDKNVEFIKEEALNQLKNKLKSIKEYIIAEEKHQDGGLHIHCFFELNIKIDISGADYFDLIFNGKVYHGNYQIGKKKMAIISYLVKECNYITNMHLPVKDGKVLKPEEHLFYICKEEGLNRAEEALYEYYPLIAAKKGSTILKNLTRLSNFNLEKKTESTELERIFKIEDFDLLSEKSFLEIIEWVNEGLSKGFPITLVFHGPPRTGKTQLGRSIFQSLGISFLEISDIQDLKKLDLTFHRGLLVDDLDFAQLNRGILLNILDSRASKTIPVKYGAVTTEAYIPRIVTTNNLNSLHNGLEELKRRTKVIYIPEKISSKFDIQIHIQNNYYFGDNIGVSKEKLDKILYRFNSFAKKLSNKNSFNSDFDKNL